VRFVLDRRHHLHEPLHIAGRDAAGHRPLEVGQVTMHARGDRAPLGGRCDHERAAIGRADLARDEAALRQAIENARQRRPLVREAAMQFGDRGGRGRGQQRQNVRLALREAVVTQIGEIEADPVRRPVNRWNETQGHRRSSTREPGSCPAIAGTRGGFRRH